MMLMVLDGCVVKGPALYAYNDAVFSEDDWKGIRMLLQSVKQHDQHKIGYFGMGFKSVFHITGICAAPMVKIHLRLAWSHCGGIVAAVAVVACLERGQHRSGRVNSRSG